MSQHRIFTLVELLVVMAVIAILSSMLLPALRKARMTSQSIVCKGNLKQLTVANSMYTNDNDAYLPWSITSNKLWDYLLMPYLNYPQNSVEASAKTDFSVFHCPLGIPHDNWKSHPYRTKGYVCNRATTCHANWAKLGYCGFRLNQLKSPTRLMLMLDGAYPGIGVEGWTFCGLYNLAFWDYQAGLDNITYDRHSSSVNISFADGHVADGHKGLYVSAQNGWYFREDYEQDPLK